MDEMAKNMFNYFLIKITFSYNTLNNNLYLRRVYSEFRSIKLQYVSMGKFSKPTTPKEYIFNLTRHRRYSIII